MIPRITVLTLGVRDLSVALAFYRDGLGFPTPGIVGADLEDGAIVFVELRGGLHLALYPTDSLARDAGLPLVREGTPRVSIGHNVATRDEVDAVIALARGAGARIVRTPRDTGWDGYAGYFQDPDDHLWEVVWNPALPPGP